MASALASAEVVCLYCFTPFSSFSPLICLLADTRTNDPLTLGLALFQHQHTGVLPSDTDNAPTALPLLDPLTSTSMPESWVRGAILIRMNSLIRGHSGVRWELIEKMGDLLRENITPLVPLRGSISASGGSSTHSSFSRPVPPVTSFLPKRVRVETL